MGRRNSCRRAVSLGVTRLEDRTLPASNITITVGANGSGSLDSFLFDASPGTIVAADGGTVPGTLSTGALTAVSPTIDINVRAQGNLTFNDLGGTLTLPTGPGHTASFSANPGSLSVANAGNTLATSGGSLFLSALGNLAVFNVNSAGGNVGLSTSSSGNTLTARSIQAGAGSVNVSNSGNTSATISQSGTVVGGDILFIGGGAVSVDDLRGTRVNLQCTAGSISSVGANAVQATVQLILVAETGITVNTLAAGIAAANHVTGNIGITQAASPARALTTLPLIGIANQAPGGSITVTNLGDAISVVSGATVVSNNGPITLAALDFNIGAAVNSGTARTTLANSTAGKLFDLGTNTANKIGLTQAELNNVTAGVLQIGSATAGATTITAAIGPLTGTSNLAIVNNVSIGQAAFSPLTMANLRISSPVVFVDNFNNNVGTLSAFVSGAGFRFETNKPLIIGTVDGVSGVVTTGGPISLLADSLDVQQALTAPNNLLQIVPSTSGRQMSLGSEGSGQLSLTDAELGRMTAGVVELGSATTTGAISVNAPITRHTGYGTLSLSSVATVGQSTGVVSVANLSIAATGNVTLGAAGNDVDTLAGRVTGAGNLFIFDDANVLAIGTVDGVSGISTNGGTTTISVVGAITDGNGSAVNVSGASMSASAGGGIDLDIDVSSVTNVSAGGPVTLTEAAAANLFSVSAGGGAITFDGGTFNQTITTVFAAGSTLNIAGATLNLQGFNDTVANVQLVSGNIIGTGTLTSANGFDVRSGSVSVRLGGGAGLTKTTGGTVTLSNANTYTGTTTIGGGTLLVNGSLPAASPISVTGGTLGGSGAVGAVTASIGTIAPGSSPGLLTANGNVSFSPNSAFVAEINGAAAGTQYDQLKVNGTVSLGGAPLNVLFGGGFVPAVGTQFVLIDNDGVDPVSGTFNGLPPGATLLVAGQRFTISYAGGTGNDVVLSKAPVAVQSVMIDDGTAQRSMVRSITVTFEGQVAFAGVIANAFQLNRTGPGGPTGPVTLAVDTSGSSANQTVARLTFLGPLTEGSGSLIDGNYTLTVLSGQVQGGIQGGDNLSSLHRLYGDVNGDKAVNGLDLTAFRNAFGTVSTDANYASFLDFNGDGAINGTDLTQFRNRFGVILP